MAWGIRPCFCGDLLLCMDELPLLGIRSLYEADCEPAMRCIDSFVIVTLCAEVACLAWPAANERSGCPHSGQSTDSPLLSETRTAKEAKEAIGLWWKSPRLSDRAGNGLQCGLSGSRVVRSATTYCGTKGETASIGNERCPAGKTNPYLSRKIYFFCRRCLSNFLF